MSRVTSKTVQKILSAAAHAPSSHNTQPWEIQFSNDTLVVGYDPARQLTVGDPNKRELFLSLGCFIESIFLAAEDYGYSTAYSFLGDTSSAVAKLKFTANAGSPKTSYTSLLTARRSDRRLYESRQIDQRYLDGLAKLRRNGAHLYITTDTKQIEFLSELTHQATYTVMSSQAFREELASWIRHNWTKKHDGMPAYTQGIPGPVSLLAKFFIKKGKNIPTAQAKKDAKRVLRSSAVGIIHVDQETPSNWVNAGRLYQTACVLALKDNIKTSAVSASVIVPETSKQVSKKLQLTNPVALLRFGYTKNNSRTTPRRRLTF